MNFMNRKNKKAIVPIVAIGVSIAVIIIIYLILYIPIPAFSKLRQSINYYLVLALWILIQIGVVYSIYEIINYVVKGFKLYKSKLLNFDFKIRHFILHK